MEGLQDSVLVSGMNHCYKKVVPLNVKEHEVWGNVGNGKKTSGSSDEHRCGWPCNASIYFLRLTDLHL